MTGAHVPKSEVRGIPTQSFLYSEPCLWGNFACITMKSGGQLGAVYLLKIAESFNLASRHLKRKMDNLWVNSSLISHVSKRQ